MDFDTLVRDSPIAGDIECEALQSFPAIIPFCCASSPTVTHFF